MSLAFGLGLLFLVFRQIERWLHQHIFKVGWLLSDSFHITTLLYYIIFLPGIALHELALWLGALVLHAQAERSIAFPAPQEIGELRLNVIRLAGDTGRFKRFVISLCPLAAGMIALWLIAVHIFRWDALLALASAGSLDSLGTALKAFLRTSSVWLWFYLAFVIANTMFPKRAGRSGKREATMVVCAAPLLAFGFWRIGGSAYPALADFIEALMSGIGLIIAQITLVNVLVLIILGAAESLIESLTKRNATFRDGKMIVQNADDTQEHKRRERHSTLPNASDQPKQPMTLRSVYDLKLPIPGPPGEEPISRSAVAILDLDEHAEQEPPTGHANLPVAAVPATPPRDADDDGEDLPFSSDAPFDRPFVARANPEPASKNRLADADEPSAEPFARPFATASPGRPTVEPARRADDKKPEASRSHAEALPKTDKPLAKRRSGARPAPKPSQRPGQGLIRQDELAGDELVYEAFDDDEPYGPGDES